MITNKMLVEDVRKMDQEAKNIISLIQDGLPEVASDLYLKTVCLDRHYDLTHPVDRLTDYRVLAGKLAVEIGRLENITANIKRRVDNLSKDAREVLIHLLGQGLQEKDGTA